jgi:hypothetical protein
LITTDTICDIFENRGGYLILTQSTGTENVFNPKLNIQIFTGCHQAKQMTIMQLQKHINQPK